MPSSKRGSSRKSAKANNNTISKTDSKITYNNSKFSNKVIGFIFTLIIQCMIIYYLYNLESEDCNCIYDWRHNYIKYFAIFLIIFNGSTITFVNMPKAAMSLFVLIILLQLVNIYAFFTYVGELNETKCKCAVDKQPLLNKIMDVYRWFQVIIILFIVIAIIFIILFMRSVFSKIDSRK